MFHRKELAMHKIGERLLLNLTALSGQDFKSGFVCMLKLHGHPCPKT